MGAPAPAAGQGETSAALMRALLGGWDAIHAGALSAVLAGTQAAPQGKTAAANSRSHSIAAIRDTWSEVILAKRVAAAPGASEGKQYRTRFGFADGAYLAIGPPLSGLLPGLDCQCS